LIVASSCKVDFRLGDSTAKKLFSKPNVITALWFTPRNFDAIAGSASREKRIAADVMHIFVSQPNNTPVSKTARDRKQAESKCFALSRYSCSCLSLAFIANLFAHKPAKESACDKVVSVQTHVHVLVFELHQTVVPERVSLFVDEGEYRGRIVRFQQGLRA